MWILFLVYLPLAFLGLLIFKVVLKPLYEVLRLKLILGKSAKILFSPLLGDRFHQFRALKL